MDSFADLGARLSSVSSTISWDGVALARGVGGAITVATDPSFFIDDPFARIFPGVVVETELFSVPPPPGPAIERYRGAAWPGGSFDWLPRPFAAHSRIALLRRVPCVRSAR